MLRVRGKKVGKPSIKIILGICMCIVKTYPAKTNLHVPLVQWPFVNIKSYVAKWMTEYTRLNVLQF